MRPHRIEPKLHLSRENISAMSSNRLFGARELSPYRNLVAAEPSSLDIT